MIEKACACDLRRGFPRGEPVSLKLFKSDHSCGDSFAFALAVANTDPDEFECPFELAE